MQRFAAGKPLNAPWGVVLAPTTGFGGASGDIIVGNFGDGGINAFNAEGAFQPLLNQGGQPIGAPGLWELRFGGGAVSDPRTLFITMGIDAGTHGQFATLTPAN